VYQILCSGGYLLSPCEYHQHYRA